ncbi:MAG: hypothetical protein AAGA31_17075, partial [Bacteroidota bacterium]
MDFIEYTNTWAKNEVTQGWIMVGSGFLLALVLYSIYVSQNELLRGAMIPLTLLLVVFLGYGSYILYSRPAHAKTSISRYETNVEQAI